MGYKKGAASPRRERVIAIAEAFCCQRLRPGDHWRLSYPV